MDWTEWLDCNIDVKIDSDNDIIVIYSKETQAYQVYDAEEKTSDGSGGQIFKFYVIDQDNDKGTVRIRVTSDGDAQLYVDFDNIMWVYNIEEQ